MKNINKLLCCIIIIINSNCLLSQEKSETCMISNLKLEYQYLLPNECNKDGRIIFQYCDNYLYVFNEVMRPITTEDILYIYKINSNGTQRIAFSLTVNERDWIGNYCIANNLLYVLTQYHIYTYNIVPYRGVPFNTKASDVLPIRDIKLGTDSFSDIIVENGKIIILKSCYSCDNPGIRIAEYDTIGNLKQTHEFNIPPGFQLEMLSPKKRLYYYHNKYIKANVLDYNIAILNNNFDTVAVLHRYVEALKENKENDRIFDSLSYNEWQKENNSPSRKMMQTNRIELVDFYDEKTIFLCYSDWSKDAPPYMYFYDIWKYNADKDKWELYKKDLINSKLNHDELVDPKFVIGGLFNSYTISNNKILCTNYTPFDLKKMDLSKLTYKELFKMNEDYYKNNELRLSVFVYSIK